MGWWPKFQIVSSESVQRALLSHFGYRGECHTDQRPLVVLRCSCRRQMTRPLPPPRRTEWWVLGGLWMHHKDIQKHRHTVRWILRTSDMLLWLQEHGLIGIDVNDTECKKTNTVWAPGQGDQSVAWYCEKWNQLHRGSKSAGTFLHYFINFCTTGWKVAPKHDRASTCFSDGCWHSLLYLSFVFRLSSFLKSFKNSLNIILRLRKRIRTTGKKKKVGSSFFLLFFSEFWL